jgi:hypothetical protein
MIEILAYWVRRCGLNNCNSTDDIDETCFKLTNEEDREEVRSGSLRDDKSITNSDEFLATGGN